MRRLFLSSFEAATARLIPANASPKTGNLF
jgi:hypothetical protein